MKKFFELIGFIVLSFFSFYYTNKTSMVIKNTDDIMIGIKDNLDKFKIEAKDASLDGFYIIPGNSGSEIDISKSYDVMKKIGLYSDNLLVFKKIKPNFSIDKVYNKYISINPNKNAVSLVFKVTDITYLKNALKILDEENIQASFFADDISILSEIKLHTIGILTNDAWAKTLVTKSFKRKNAYCYLEEEDSDALNMCSMNKMHSIIPSLIVKKSPALTIKKNLKKGMIISLELNRQTISELPYIISYVKSKNMDLLSLDKFLEE